jgi:hypothetical protein
MSQQAIANPTFSFVVAKNNNLHNHGARATRSDSILAFSVSPIGLVSSKMVSRVFFNSEYSTTYFDKTLSLLLLRPPSLPDLKVKPTQLIHIDPDLPRWSEEQQAEGFVKVIAQENTGMDIFLGLGSRTDGPV